MRPLPGRVDRLGRGKEVCMYRKLVLGFIEADFCNSRLIVQNFEVYKLYTLLHFSKLRMLSIFSHQICWHVFRILLFENVLCVKFVCVFADFNEIVSGFR